MARQATQISNPPAAGRFGFSLAKTPELQALKQSLRGVFIAVIGFSGVINLLGLTGSLFMLQVYDRVLTSRSMATLTALCALALMLYGFQGAMESIRTRLLVRLGGKVDEALGERVFRVLLALPLRVAGGGAGSQPLRDMDTIRTFLTGQGPSALADLPWIPIYLVFVFMLHTYLGLMALGGALCLIAMTAFAEWRSREASVETMQQTAKRFAYAESVRRNAEVITAMGLTTRMTDRFLKANSTYLATQQKASDLTGGLSATARVFRLVLQSAMLAMGAYLTIRGDMTGGAIIASSIATTRALAPVDMAIANWRMFASARQSWFKLSELLSAFPAEEEPTALPAPCESISVEELVIAAPGSYQPILHNISFSLTAGSAVAIVGPSGSGKSTLARALTGVWPSLKGTIRLDGADLRQWSRERLGPHIGYLPQDIELFEGSVAQNIARFTPDADAEDIIAAARAAQVHEMILQLPQGYDTPLGEAGGQLSAGQRQRVGLARALYGNPFLIVLDEPNAHLDLDGEQALVKAIHESRQRGAVVILIAHRQGILNAVDKMAVMQNGMLQHFGPRDEILRKIMRPLPGRVEVPQNQSLRQGTA